uniref:EGF-like domain-containing protein n=1 Tax=Naja naja TaxID=35670 RepID=A0A8C6XKK1_NAJNA
NCFLYKSNKLFFHARCQPSLIGERCQFQDPCHQSPCANGGSCGSTLRDGTVHYQCTCPKGFRGKDICLLGWQYNWPSSMFIMYFLFCLGQDCSLFDACASKPCVNGGRCTNWNGRYNCTCPSGYQGRNCRSDVDECRVSGLCQHGGTCLNTPGSFRCQCQAGYTGQHCESISTPCAPSQCLNGGTCRQTGDLSYECACLPGEAVTTHNWEQERNLLDSTLLWKTFS